MNLWSPLTIRVLENNNTLVYPASHPVLFDRQTVLETGTPEKCFLDMFYLIL